MEKKTEVNIQIYVACLASYNNGILHGAWIDALQEVSDIQDKINQMLKTSPMPNAECYAIHDNEGFEGVYIAEYASIQSITQIALFIKEHGKLGAKLLDHFGDIGDARRAIEEHYSGEYKSVADFAEDITEQTTQIPSSLQYYIDYERMAQDMEINDILAIETAFEEIHIFWRF